MNKLIFVLFSITGFLKIYGQQVNFSHDIAPPVFKNCTPCHKKGEIGPFTLENYEDVKHHARMIKYAVSTHYMPPWKADNQYQSFHNERKIDSNFLSLLIDWIKEGYPEGKPATVYTSALSKQVEDKPDYIIKMPSVFKLDITAQDVFISFTDSIDFKEARYIKGIKIVPGNKRLLHHCRVDFDTTNRFVKLMEKDGFVTTNALEGNPMPTYQFVGDYVPGISSYRYPKNIGYKVNRKIYALVNLHYSPNSKDDVDSTKVFVYLYPKGYKPRVVSHICLTSNTKGPNNRDLKVPADSVSYLSLIGDPIDTPVSVISIQPHMHLLGHSMKVYAVTPSQDTIQLININDWDFNWQENYYFNKMIILPKGTILRADAVFDNTTLNPKNPSNPPQDVFFNGEMKTTNEMFEFYMQTVIYQKGDENLHLYD